MVQQVEDLEERKGDLWSCELKSKRRRKGKGSMSYGFAGQGGRWGWGRTAVSRPIWPVKGGRTLTSEEKNDRVTPSSTVNKGQIVLLRGKEGKEGGSTWTHKEKRVKLGL